MVAYMVEHEAFEGEPVGTEQHQDAVRNAPRVFRATELNRCVLPPRAGYGGYSHPWAAGLSRTDVIRALAGDAELKGWINRERDRYGGVHRYILTLAGRDVYRKKIKPQRDAFVAEYITGTRHTSSSRPAILQAKRATGKI